MVTVKKDYIDTKRQYSAPAGNAYRGDFNMNLLSGILVESDLATAIGIDDIVKLGILPAGLRIQDALICIYDVFTASSTFTIGFAYVDGVDSTAVPEDADYFTAALAADSASRTAADNTAVAPVTLPKDAYLILTNGIAAQDTDSDVAIFFEGILTGHP